MLFTIGVALFYRPIDDFPKICSLFELEPSTEIDRMYTNNIRRIVDNIHELFLLRPIDEGK